jgi:hypothetical protein
MIYQDPLAYLLGLEGVARRWPRPGISELESAFQGLLSG